jgi:hypothetical protein
VFISPRHITPSFSLAITCFQSRKGEIFTRYDKAHGMKNPLPPALVTIALLCILSGCTIGPRNDIRDQLLASSKQSDSSFPNQTSVKLTRFAYLGRLRTGTGDYYVIDMRSVITGMAAPRGLNFLVFFDKDRQWIGKQHYDTPPLWCQGSRVYMSGLEIAGESEGNVWDLNTGFADRKLLIAPEYGSYLPE